MAKRLFPKPRKCIFCGERNADSREHFYSEWMAALLPTFKEQSYRQVQSTRHHIFGERIEIDNVKPGHLHTRRLKRVCSVCNNGWMNRAETAARPLLEALIEGRNFSLLESGMIDVARWIAIKAVVAEHSDPSRSSTPPTVRKALQNSKIPEQFRIYLISHNSGSGSGYARHTTSIVFPGERPIDFLESGRPNVQQITWLMGEAVVHINSTFDTNFCVEDMVSSPVYRQNRIWPLPGIALEWPSAIVLSNDGVFNLSSIVDRFTKDPARQWGGDRGELLPW